jgi:hypothetical protein
MTLWMTGTMFVTWSKPMKASTFGKLDASLGAFHDRQGALVALGHAAGDDELLALLAGGGLAVAHLVDGFESLVLRGVDEGAGVDDDDVRLGGVGGHGHPGLGQVADHDLGVDQVLGAAKGDEAYFDRHGGIRSGDPGKCNLRRQRVSQSFRRDRFRAGEAGQPVTRQVGQPSRDMRGAGNKLLAAEPTCLRRWVKSMRATSRARGLRRRASVRRRST